MIEYRVRCGNTPPGTRRVMTAGEESALVRLGVAVYVAPDPVPEPILPAPKPADVRRWARDHDVECPTKGRIPREVMECYRRWLQSKN